EKARLADAGFADHRRDLTPALAGQFLCPPELLEFAIASHKSRETAAGRCVETSTRNPHSGDLEYLERLGKTLHGHASQRAHRHETLGEVKGSRGHDDGAREGQLLHACGEMRGLADSGVVHAQITANRTYDDVTRVESHANPDVDAVSLASVLR